jgi:hypothetical protein
MTARKRIGRDSSFLPLMLGPVGIGIPKWMPLVFVYFGAVFGISWTAGPPAANVAGAIGPGLIGLLDLLLRLRITHYEWDNSTGLRLVSEASLVDRLTFRECGWYVPILALPLPLWLLGMGLSVVFSHSWGVF